METKPGYLTTEFWSHFVFQLLAFLNDYGVWSFVPARFMIPAQAVVAGLYYLARGWAKSGVAYDPVTADTLAATAREKRIARGAGV
jgi:hypothetical protein